MVYYDITILYIYTYISDRYIIIYKWYIYIVVYQNYKHYMFTMGIITMCLIYIYMIVYPKMDLKDTIDYNGNMADIVGVYSRNTLYSQCYNYPLVI
jgi:hypothetical protein